jgi:hypothetical protein
MNDGKIDDSLKILSAGYRTIQLYQKVPGIGCNFHPHTLVWEVLTNVLVNECDFNWLNQYQWVGLWEPSAQDYHARRHERLSNGKYVDVIMAREILGLQRGTGLKGDLADHKDYDIRNDVRENLRIATPGESGVNKRDPVSQHRFKGINRAGSGFRAIVRHKYQIVHFSVMETDVKAALMYNYATYLLNGEFATLNQISEDEMPPYEQQVDLYKWVVKKLTAVRLITGEV